MMGTWWQGERTRRNTETRESAVALAGIGLDDASDDVSLDELTLLPGGLSEGGSGEAVEVAHGAGGRFVEEGNGVAGE